MKISLWLPTEEPTAIAECAAAIEQAGFDACFVTDHPYPPRPWLEHGGHRTVDPFVALAAAATATTTLRLHTHCYIPAYREPHLGAQAIATLQALSNGRVILGVAAGYLEEEFEGLGVSFAERGKLLDEALVTMQSSWAGESANLTMPSIAPPPIWVGGNTEIAMRRAATFDGWAPFPASRAMAAATRTADLSSLDTVAAAIARFRAIARPEADVCFAPFSHPAHKDVVDPAAFAAEARELAAVGVTWLTLHLPAPSPREFCASVAAFGREVAG
jgi:probable F420-dependent oxidoreductase